jgi:cell wall-associated NlpC family hydrolase
MRWKAILAVAFLCVTYSGIATADDEGAAPALRVAGSAEQYLVRAHELMLQALSVMGVRYRYGGDTPLTGFDCSGFVRYVFNQIGTALPRSASEISRSGRAVERDELQPGDLVFFGSSVEIVGEFWLG